jgi:S1-C subfamily serine protease
MRKLLLILLLLLFSPLALAEEATGTGFFISSDGTGMTAAHVLIGGKNPCAMLENTCVPILIIKIDAVRDVAIFKVLVDHSVPSFKIATKDVDVGDTVVSVGYPVPDTLVEQPTYVQGIVNKIDEHGYRISSIRTLPGASGSPIINDNGEVVGVVQAVRIYETQILPNYSMSAPLVNVQEILKGVSLSTLDGLIDIIREHLFGVSPKTISAKVFLIHVD